MRDHNGDLGPSIHVRALARVEGEGGLEVIVRDGKVTDARLDIYEPPRFFEALLRGAGTPRCRTSPRGSAGSARSPTR